jgi:hypothetical protein
VRDWFAAAVWLSGPAWEATPATARQRSSAAELASFMIAVLERRNDAM